MGATSLQDRDAAGGCHPDHGAELVEQQRPWRVGMFGGVVEVRKREDRQRGRLVGHRVRVGAPHHDRPFPERLDQPDGDHLAVSGRARGHELPPGQGERDLEPVRAAGEILHPLGALDVASVLGSRVAPMRACSSGSFSARARSAG